MYDIDVSIEHNNWYGHISKNNITLYIKNMLLHILYSNEHDYIPLFNTIEDGIHETIIHELIHVYTGEKNDAKIDGWIKMLCSYHNGGCSCPIDCAIRDITSIHH